VAQGACSVDGKQIANRSPRLSRSLQAGARALLADLQGPCRGWRIGHQRLIRGQLTSAWSPRLAASRLAIAAQLRLAHSACL